MIDRLIVTTLLFGDIGVLIGLETRERLGALALNSHLNLLELWFNIITQLMPRVSLRDEDIERMFDFVYYNPALCALERLRRL